MHEVRMLKHEVSDENTVLTRKMYEDSLAELGRRKKDKYKFILKAGGDFHNALFHTFQNVWVTEIIPEQWRDTKIIQLYKGKGNEDEFSSQRHIHIKQDIPKLFGHITDHKSTYLH